MCPAWKPCIFVEVDDLFEEERNLIPSSYQILALLSFARGIIRLALRTSLRSFSASLIKVDLPGIIPSKLSKIHISIFESNLVLEAQVPASQCESGTCLYRD
jgi:hypothetical protein